MVVHSCNTISWRLRQEDHGYRPGKGLMFQNENQRLCRHHLPTHFGKATQNIQGYQLGGREATWFWETQSKWQFGQLITMSYFYSVHHLSLQCVFRANQGCSISEISLWESIVPGHVCCSGSQFQGCSALSPPSIFPSIIISLHPPLPALSFISNMNI